MISADLASLAVPIDALKLLPGNPRRGDVDAIAASLERFGQRKPVVARRSDSVVIAGNHTLQAAQQLGWTEIAAVWTDDDEATAKAYALADNRTAELGGYDEAELAALIEQVQEADAELLAATGWTDGDLKELLARIEQGDGAEEERAAAAKSLAERFGVPPFTVLDARAGYWQQRKESWLSLGLASNEGRATGLVGGFDTATLMNSCGVVSEMVSGGTSIFDPVLCELLVRWYSAPGHAVLDPFAGGSVRGLVTHRLGRTYTGIDLRPEQVSSNTDQAQDWTRRGLLAGAPPRWLVGDARVLPDLTADRYDLMLTCPPYFDLEQYSDDKRDLSRCADYPTFLSSYRECLEAATRRMGRDAFAAIVTGAVRDKDGYIRDLPADTTRIMEEIGWRLYQDAILVQPPVTAQIRAARVFPALRKLTRVHQSVGVYHRGRIDQVRKWPPVEAGEVTESGDPES